MYKIKSFAIIWYDLWNSKEIIDMFPPTTKDIKLVVD